MCRHCLLFLLALTMSWLLLTAPAPAQDLRTNAQVEIVQLDFAKDAAVGTEFTATATVRNGSNRLMLVNVNLHFPNSVQVVVPGEEQIVFIEANATQPVRWQLKRLGGEAGQMFATADVLTEGRPGRPTGTVTVPAADQAALRRVWTGDWTTPRGFHFTAELRLNPGPDGTVEGRILWPLRKSPREEEQAKVGQTGTEFVWGSFDPRSRALTLEGYRKDDPNHILGLDKYRLLLADDGRVIGGITWEHGGWEAKFHLTPKATP
jgi:hypothetical protein